MSQRQNAASASNSSVVAGFKIDSTGRLESREVSWPEAITAAVRRYILRKLCKGDANEFLKELNNWVNSQFFKDFFLKKGFAANFFLQKNYIKDDRLSAEEAAFVATIPGENLIYWNAPSYYYGPEEAPEYETGCGD